MTGDPTAEGATPATSTARTLHENPHANGTIALPEAFVRRLLATIEALEAELEIHRLEAPIGEVPDLAEGAG